MSRISAGSTLVNQYAPPFIVSDNVDVDWVLRWNPLKKAFEAQAPTQSFAYVSVSTATYSATVNDRIFGVDTNTIGAASTINLASIANFTKGTIFTVKDETGDADSFSIIVQPSGSATIDNAASYTINTSRGYVTFYSNGTNYFIISAA